MTEIQETGHKAIACEADVTKYGDIQNLVSICKITFGRGDILVNNAGLIEPIALLAESNPEAWVHTADINYKGVYYGLRAAIPVMLEQGGGTIVNISSVAAYGALEGWSHYCSSKAAALSLTKCADVEYREKGIRVLGLSPGAVDTGMQLAIKASGINRVSQLDPSVHIPPQWVARAVAWLCTEEASDLCGTDLALREEDTRKRVGLI